MFESAKVDKSGLKSGGHIQPGPDLKKMVRFRPGPDMISGATLVTTYYKPHFSKFTLYCIMISLT